MARVVTLRIEIILVTYPLNQIWKDKLISSGIHWWLWVDYCGLENTYCGFKWIPCIFQGSSLYDHYSLAQLNPQHLRCLSMISILDYSHYTVLQPSLISYPLYFYFACQSKECSHLYLLRHSSSFVETSPQDLYLPPMPWPWSWLLYYISSDSF